MSISIKYTDKHGRPVRPNAKVAVWRGKPDTSPVVAMLHSSILSKAAAGTDAGGEALAPYSARYARETGKTRPNLTRTGAMLATLKVKAGKTSGYIHPRAKYAAVHNFGWPARGIPAREFFGFSQKVADGVTAEVDRRVVANTKVSFGARRALSRGLL